MTAKRDGDFRQGAMAAAASDRMLASDYLTRAEDLLATQTGRTVDANRPYVARALQITVSSCHNIRRQRRKIVPGWLKEKIIGLFVDAAQNELRAIEHEIEVARQIGLGNSDGKLIEARTRAAALVRILDSVCSEGASAGPGALSA
jgi:hypothetical protein